MHALLTPLTWPYAAAIRARNARYDRARGVRTAIVPVISVGNITTGGTGKTPLVMAIVRRLLAEGRRPAIVTRGYAARAGEVPDEVLEFRAALPGVPVVIDPDRVAGASTAYTVFNADCVVLDDGFQHRRLARALDIVVVDALDPFGGGERSLAGLLLPAGRLREPLAGLRRAGLLVISRCNQVAPEQLEQIAARLRRCNAHAPIIHAGVAASRVTYAGRESESPDELGYRCVMPICGIGNPESFLRLVDELAGRVVETHRLADHFRYTPFAARLMARRAQRAGADVALTTGKDWVKLAPLWPTPGRGEQDAGSEARGGRETSEGSEVRDGREGGAGPEGGGGRETGEGSARREPRGGRERSPVREGSRRSEGHVELARLDLRLEIVDPDGALDAALQKALE